MHTFTQTGKGLASCMCCFHVASVRLSRLWEDMAHIQHGSFLPVTAPQSNCFWKLPQSYRGVFCWSQTFLSTVKLATNTNKVCFTALPMYSHVRHLREEKVQVDFWFQELFTSLVYEALWVKTQECLWFWLICPKPACYLCVLFFIFLIKQAIFKIFFHYPYPIRVPIPSIPSIPST